jgi:hypothetical protein
MRRVLLVALCLAAVPLACKTTQPEGTENREPIQGPTEVREPIQNVPENQPGPATPLPDADGGTGGPSDTE